MSDHKSGFCAACEEEYEGDQCAYCFDPEPEFEPEPGMFNAYGEPIRSAWSTLQDWTQ